MPTLNEHYSVYILAGLLAGLLGWVLHLLSDQKEKTFAYLTRFVIVGVGLAFLLPLAPVTTSYLWNTTLVILLGFLLAVTWNDIKDQTAPNFMTLGVGTILVVLMILQVTLQQIPIMTGSHIFWGIVTGMGTLIGISIITKLTFGRKALTFQDAETFQIDKETKTVTMGGDTYDLSLFFKHGTGKVEFVSPENETLVTIFNPEGKTKPENPPTDKACNKIVIPRETLGAGDVKFMLGVGAVLGPQGALFTIIGGALLGAIGGMPLRKQETEHIPLTPFLAGAAMIYLWKGPEVLQLLQWK